MLLAVALFTFLAVRAYDKQRGPPLELWHTHAPPELSGASLRDADWDAWLAAENAAFADLRSNVTAKLEGTTRNPANRFYEGSPLHPGHFAHDWNRTYVLEPDARAGRRRGPATRPHRFTLQPAARRKALSRAAATWRSASGFPAHGTAPAALAEVDWQDWMTATRLAVREALRRAGPAVPFHIVGYSNGGALAVKYALDAL